MSTAIAPVSNRASNVRGQPTFAAAAAAVSAGTRDDAPLAHEESGAVRARNAPRRSVLSTVTPTNRVPVVAAAHKRSRSKKTLPDRDDVCAASLALLISASLIVLLL